MSATRCKLRWAHTGLSPHLNIPARARCFGTRASPEGVNREDNLKPLRDGSSRGPLSNRYSGQRLPVYRPRAYKPHAKSYAGILISEVSEPSRRLGVVLGQLFRTWRPREGFSADETSSQPHEHVLDRSLLHLTSHFARIQPALAAVSQDVSGHLVPDLYTPDFAAMRSHHLGRWYANESFFGEHLRIEYYLRDVTLATRTVARFLASAHIHTPKQHRYDYQAVVYAMVCELRAARLARQWHQVWTLERKVATYSSMLLQPRALASICQELLNRDDERMTEISMSRMAEWNDSYKSLYEDDVYTRQRMNLVKRYWTVLNSKVHEKPWQGGSAVFEVKSPTSSDKEIIVLRKDQLSTPSPLWPRVWAPTVLGVAHKIKRRAKPTPPGTGRHWMRKGGVGKDMERKSQQQSSQHATSDIPEA